MKIVKIGSPEATSDIRVLGGNDMFGMHWCKNACICVNFRVCGCWCVCVCAGIPGAGVSAVVGAEQR